MNRIGRRTVICMFVIRHARGDLEHRRSVTGHHGAKGLEQIIRRARFCIFWKPNWEMGKTMWETIEIKRILECEGIHEGEDRHGGFQGF
jgi:hypothetical protein